MAKYTVTYKCGCTATIELTGKIADRDRKIEWYKTIDCPSCRAKAAQAEAEANNLVALVGSEKQIAWASSIRNNAFENCKGLVEKSQKRDMAQKIVDMLMSETSASFWIDNRDVLNGTLKDFAIFAIKYYQSK